MRGTTHLLAGASVGAAWSLCTGETPVNAAVMIGVSAVAGLLPDLDTPGSTLGRRVPIFSFLVKLTLGHRGMLHGILPWIGFWLLISRIPAAAFLAVPGVLATLSHLILDALTPSGVPLLWPLGIQIHLGRIRTGGLMDFLLRVVFLALLVWIISVKFFVH